MASEAYRNMRANTPGHLSVLSIFATVDGECNGFGQGSMSVFIRLTGCRVGCNYCDTKYSWALGQGRQMTPDEIVDEVISVGQGISKVTLTGGEPLEQDGEEMLVLLRALIAKGYAISIETSGMLSFAQYIHSDRISLVVDLKSPATVPGHQVPLLEEMVRLTDRRHYIKVVITDFPSFIWALTTVADLRSRGCDATVYFSPDHNRMPAHELFNLMMTDAQCRQMNIGLNMQLHKYLFPENFREEELYLPVTDKGNPNA